MTPRVVEIAMGGASVSSCLSESSRFGLLLLALAVSSCGGGGSGPTSPAPTPTPATQPPAAGPTVTITAAGVSPKQIEIAVGARVTFVNNDTAFHEMASDPHPVHTDCPPMNEVGAVTPGQSRQTGPFLTARTCGFHDHGQPTNPALQGTIVIR